MGSRNFYRIWIFILSLVVLVETFLLFSVARRFREKESLVKKPVSWRPVVSTKPKIAIVIDDWGYNLKNFSLLKELGIPVTLAILPRLPFSRQISDLACKNGFETILHLPMEPYEKVSLEKNTILVTQNSEQITQILEDDLESMFCVKGVSNHMGSKATAESKTMRTVLKCIKKHGLYFLDSFVSSRSVAAQIASDVGLPYVRRDIFLDNRQAKDYIKGQMQKLKAKADLKGKAVGIGHDRRLTLETLKEVIPELKKQGYRFVLVSELIS